MSSKAPPGSPRRSHRGAARSGRESPRSKSPDHRSPTRARPSRPSPQPPVVTPPPMAAFTQPLSTVERVMKEVEPPLDEPLEHEFLFPRGDDAPPDCDVLKEHFFREGRLSIEDARELIQRASEMFRSEPNVLMIEGPATTCGDIHGQFYDLVELFEVGGTPGDVCYLFLGDYVDRGYFSCEVTLYLFALKVAFPEKFFMLRGNHECRHVTNFFNFKMEAKHKYCQEVYDDFMDAFDCLPLSAVVRTNYGQFLCVHGGLSPDIANLEEIVDINRFMEPPETGPLCDLLWADPFPDDGEEDLEELRQIEFMPNTIRGCSYYFGYGAVVDFLESNDILSVIRAHEVQPEGYKLHRNRSDIDFPSVVTLFSAPNYCDTHENKAAILVIDNDLFEFSKFDWSPHPFGLPNFMDCFTWSLPFVAEKVAEFLLSLMETVDDELEDDEDETVSSLNKERGDKIKAKIRAMGKMVNILSSIRSNQEIIVQLKGLVPGNKLPPGLLAAGPGALHEALQGFERARRLDVANDKRPPFREDDAPPGYQSPNAHKNRRASSRSPSKGGLVMPPELSAAEAADLERKVTERLLDEDGKPLPKIMIRQESKPIVVRGDSRTAVARRDSMSRGISEVKERKKGDVLRRDSRGAFRVDERGAILRHALEKAGATAEPEGESPSRRTPKP